MVGVFVAGPMWQFKNWPGLTVDGAPVEIFTKSETAPHLRMYICVYFIISLLTHSESFSC